MNLVKIAVASAALAFALPANAAVVLSIPGGTVYEMPVTNAFGDGPSVFGNNITWTSTTSNSVFGYTNGYFFNDNGNWQGLPAMAGLNTSFGSMTFTLDKDVSAVGGIINWAKAGQAYQNASMSIFNSSNVLLETFSLMNGATNQVTPDSFYGFSRAQGDIRSFVVSDSFIGLRSLTVDAVAPVPEPATWMLMLIGMAGVGYSMRRKGKQTLRVRFA